MRICDALGLRQGCYYQKDATSGAYFREYALVFGASRLAALHEIWNPWSNDSKQWDKHTWWTAPRNDSLNKLPHFQTSLLKQLQRCTKTRIKRDLLGSWYLKRPPAKAMAWRVWRATSHLAAWIHESKISKKRSASANIESRAKFPKKVAFFAKTFKLCCAMHSDSPG